MTPLGARKQLLLAESDLNRARMLQDAAAFSAGVHSATHRLRSIGSIASSALAWMATVTALRSSRNSTAGVRPSPLEKLLKGAGVITTFVLACVSRRQRKADPKPTPPQSSPRAVP